MKYATRKVYIKESGSYVELSYRDFCRRRQADQSYMDKLFKIRLYIPQEQQRLEWRIEGIQMDIATLAEHPLPADSYIGIDLLGQHFDERKKAGIVLLA